MEGGEDVDTSASTHMGATWDRTSWNTGVRGGGRMGSGAGAGRGGMMPVCARGMGEGARKARKWWVSKKVYIFQPLATL